MITMKNYTLGEDYVPYTKELIEHMYNVRIGGMPASFFLLDMRKTNTQCHASSNILAYVLKDAKRMTGESAMISGADKSHSWVEDDEFVYETTEGTIWKKESYYDREKPTNVHEVSKEQVIKELDNLVDKEVPKEVMVAYIQDMKFNLIGKPYEKELDNHMDRFSEEKDLSNYSIAKMYEYMFELRKAYSRIKMYAKEQDEKAIDSLLGR